MRRSPATRGLKSGGQFFSICHPDFSEAERAFVNGHLFGHLPDDSDRVDKLTVVLSRLKNQKTRDFAATQAVEFLGIAALFPAPWEDDADALTSYSVAEEARLRGEIREIVKERLQSWHTASRSGRDLDTRSFAADRLKSIGPALAGEQRGRRKRIVPDAVELAGEYLRCLFRLQRAEALFANWQVPSRSQRIKDVARACGIPEDILIHHLKVSLTPEASARAWVADTFGVGDGTVSNVLSRSRK